MNQYFPKYSLFILLVLIIVLLGIYPFFETFFYSLRGMHMWRQADCLSISSCYAIYDVSFFETRMLNLGLVGNGKTISDFPLIYWLTSFFYKNENYETIYRIFTFSIYSIGVILLFRLFEGIFKDSVFSIFLILLLFSSPALVYYSNNYLMNSPSLGLSFIGYWFAYKFWKTQENKFMVFWFFLSLFAALLKITALIHPIIVTSAFILSYSKKIISIGTLKKYFAVLLFMCLMVFIWVSYAKHYNESNNSGIFLTGILPLWKMNILDQSTILNEIYGRMDDLVNPIFFFALLGTVIWILFKVLKFKSIDFMSAFILLYFSGFLCYFILFFQVLNDHDYYFTNWIPLFIIAPVIWLYSNIKNKRIMYAFQVALIVLLIDSSENCYNRLSDKYTSWKNEYYTSYIVHFENAKKQDNFPLFDKNDKVYVPSDHTINASLLTLNTQGWTGYNELFKTNRFEKVIDQGLSHIVVFKQETLINGQHDLSEVLLFSELVFDSEFLSIYKLKKT